jgi:hypothetical protein
LSCEPQFETAIGGASDPIQISSLSVSPDPIDLNANITVAAAVAIAKNITAPITVS